MNTCTCFLTLVTFYIYLYNVPFRDSSKNSLSLNKDNPFGKTNILMIIFYLCEHFLENISSEWMLGLVNSLFEANRHIFLLVAWFLSKYTFCTTYVLYIWFLISLIRLQIIKLKDL